MPAIPHLYCPDFTGDYALVFDWKSFIKDIKKENSFLLFLDEFMRVYYCKLLPLQTYQFLGILPEDEELDLEVVNRSYLQWVKESNRFFGKEQTKKIISEHRKKAEKMMNKIMFPVMEHS